MLYRILLLMFLSGCLCAEIELTFLPNKPVEQHSLLKVDLKQHLPSLEMDATMEQKLVATVKIVDRSDLPVSRPPINMLFTLKDLSVKLSSNGKEAEYQVNKPNTSLFLAEVHDMIGEPIKLRFDEEFRLMPYTPGLVQLSKELPILSQIHPQSMIEELFQHQFALAGRSLAEGQAYTVPFDDSVGVQPKSITYTIKEINSKEIIATMEGEIPSTSINLDFEIPSGEEEQNLVHLLVDGEYTGTVRWDRNNALRYFLEATTVYHGTYHIAGWEWAIDLTITHTVSSS